MNSLEEDYLAVITIAISISLVGCIIAMIIGTYLHGRCWLNESIQQLLFNQVC